MIEVLKALTLGIDNVFQQSLGIPEQTAGGLALVALVAITKLIEFPFYLNNRKNDAKLRKEIIEWTKEEVKRARTFD